MAFRNAIFFFLLNYFYINAQVGTYFRVSGHIFLGTPINRLGFILQAGLIYERFQLFSQFRAHYQFTSWVKNKSTPELQSAIGGLLSWHKADNLPIHELLYQNFTSFSNSIGYVYHVYLDKIKTSQHSGSIVLQTHQLAFIFENDVLAGLGKDEFRTGGFKITYQMDPYHSIGLSTILWTGQTTNAIRIDSSHYLSKYGYKDLSQTLYGNHSVGIIGIDYSTYHASLGVIQTKIGVDAEPIRHIFQNKLIHDMPFIPQKWNKVRNPHYPMLDIEGKPYINPENQKIRKAEPFFQIGVNPSCFY